MKPFELVFKKGLNQPANETHVYHIGGEQMSPEEKKLLAVYLAEFMKNHGEGGFKVVDVFISGFYAGVGHAGTHLLRPKED